jgi:nucleotide-binding universal stress UspA family protein
MYAKTKRMAIMGFKTILVPLDKSDLAATAVDYAMQAAETTATIHLLAVIEHNNAETIVEVANSIEIAVTGMPAVQPRVFPSQTELTTEVSEYLAKIKTRVEARGFTVIAKTVPGSVVDTIVEQARKDSADVIVMSTHGRTGIPRLVLGSIAEGVVHKATCPVLLIPEQATIV